MRKRPGHEKNAPFGYLILRQLTFHDTPFPIWNKAADTKYGVLWDLSPRSLRKFHFMLDKDFKQQLDFRITDYLSKLEEAALPEDADFLFFLKQFWFSYAPKESQELFRLKYNQNIISQFSESFRWIQTNGQKIDSHLSRIEGPLDAKKFLKNIGYAIKTGLSLNYSPSGPVEE
jgi:hypothetical protein